MRRALWIAVLLSFPLVACDDGNGDVDAGVDAGEPDEMDAGMDDTDAGPPPEEDAGGPSDVDAGRDFIDFLDLLDGTVWHGFAERAGVTRGFEMQFVGGAEPMWGEIRNPYGPARQRIRRYIRPAVLGCDSPTRCTIQTTVVIPDASWETPPELRGEIEEWTLEIIEGDPRELAVYDPDTGVEDLLEEGEWTAPALGLTAEFRVYQGGDGNPISDAFCTSGGDLDRAAVWEFARGLSNEPTIQYDIAAGIPLDYWEDVDNKFGIRDVHGFGIDWYGGSERTDQFFFTVRYTGMISHPGGNIRMMESDSFDPTDPDDDFEDAIFSFINFGVGSTLESDLFLEVHGFAWADATPDVPVRNISAGGVPVEIIVLRCDMRFGSRGLGVALSLNDAPFNYFTTGHPIVPEIDDTLFPPVL
jgi:hypothetical protein